MISLQHETLNFAKDDENVTLYFALRHLDIHRNLVTLKS